MSYFNFIQSKYCPNHDDNARPDQFYLKTGVKDARTKGHTFFICGQNGCSNNQEVEKCPLFECPKHLGKSIELQYVELGRKISVRCSEMKNGWCKQLHFNETNANLKVFKPLSDITNVPFICTSTPKVTAPTGCFKTNQQNNRLLQNFESSGDCSSLSNSLVKKNESDAFDAQKVSADVNESHEVSPKRNSIDGEENARSSKNVVEDSDDSRIDDVSENGERAQENSSLKVIRVQNNSRDVTAVVDNSSESVHIMVDSPSRQKSGLVTVVQSSAVRPKLHRLRFDDSSKDSVELHDNSDRSRSILLTNKEKHPQSDTRSFTQIRDPAKRIESSDSEADNENEEDHDDIEELSENKSKVEDISTEAFSKAVEIEDPDSSFEIPPISQKKNESYNDFVEGSNSSNEKPVASHSSPKPTSSTFEHLTERLNTLLAAKRKARFLPDGGARLDAKIDEVRQQIRALDFSPMAARTDAAETNPFAPLTNAALEMQAKTLFATNDDQRFRLYGGRMNEARRMEVKAVTNDAIEELHSAVTNIPLATEETEDPKGLTIPLMTHQRQALTWLKWRENKKPPGGILADDMGLGKTLTMISLVLCNRAARTEGREWHSKKLLGELVPSRATLVICPASLVFQWEKEIEKRVKSGYLNTLVFHGPRREISAERMSSFDFVITSYATVASEVGDDDKLKKETKRKTKNGTSVLLKIGWERIILDEAHVIKNPACLTSRACCRLPAAKRWVLTGTPIHNCLKDLYSLLKFLRCEPFDEWEVWKRWIENKSDIAKERLNTIIKSVMLRRTKNQECLTTGRPLVALPPKKFETHNLDLFPLERKVYDRLFDASKRQVAEFVRMQEERDGQLIAISRGTASHHQFGFKNPFLPRKFQESGNDGQTPFNQSHILVLLLRLRQACTHLALMKEAVDIDAFDDENAEENLAQQLNNMSLFEEKEIVAAVDSNVGNLFERGYVSTKLKMILDQIDAISLVRENGEIQKMVVVSQWAKLLDIIGIHLCKRNVPFAVINGTVKPEDRNIRVEQFNDRKRGPVVMLLSLTAGGVGLNLVGGNHLFLVDMHWNPALEQQACDRIYRMGQTRNVFIHKFLCTKTIEEKVFALQNQKSSLADAVITGAKKVGPLSKDDLKFLFGLNETIRRNERK